MHIEEWNVDYHSPGVRKERHQTLNWPYMAVETKLSVFGILL